MSSLYFQIISLFYIVLVMIMYFSKKKISSVENTVFSYLIVINFFGLILDIVSTYLAIINYDSIVLIIMCKMYLCYLVVWITVMTLYIFVISVKDKSKENIEKIIKILKFF